MVQKAKMDVLLPVFQLLYFVAHFLYSLAENVSNMAKILTGMRELVYLKANRWLEGEGSSSLIADNGPLPSENGDRNGGRSDGNMSKYSSGPQASEDSASKPNGATVARNTCCKCHSGSLLSNISDQNGDRKEGGSDRTMSSLRHRQHYSGSSQSGPNGLRNGDGGSGNACSVYENSDSQPPQGINKAGIARNDGDNALKHQNVMQCHENTSLMDQNRSKSSENSDSQPPQGINKAGIARNDAVTPLKSTKLPCQSRVMPLKDCKTMQTTTKCPTDTQIPAKMPPKVCDTILASAPYSEVSRCSVANPKHFQKLPKHVALISPSNLSDIFAVASLVASVASYGVRNISIYDIYGDFSSRKAEILSELRKFGQKVEFRLRERDGEIRASEREALRHESDRKCLEYKQMPRMEDRNDDDDDDEDDTSPTSDQKCLGSEARQQRPRMKDRVAGDDDVATPVNMKTREHELGNIESERNSAGESENEVISDGNKPISNENDDVKVKIEQEAVKTREHELGNLESERNKAGESENEVKSDENKPKSKENDDVKVKNEQDAVKMSEHELGNLESERNKAGEGENEVKSDGNKPKSKENADVKVKNEQEAVKMMESAQRRLESEGSGCKKAESEASDDQNLGDEEGDEHKLVKNRREANMSENDQKNMKNSGNNEKESRTIENERKYLKHNVQNGQTNGQSSGDKPRPVANTQTRAGRHKTYKHHQQQQQLSDPCLENNNDNKPTIILTFLGLRDGREELANVAERLAIKFAAQTEKTAQRTSKLAQLADDTRETAQIPAQNPPNAPHGLPLPKITDILDLLTHRPTMDPELVITIGQKNSIGLNSTLGFPPLSLRVSEIHFLSLSEGIVGLRNIMEAYAGCEQRWGR